MPNWPFSKYVLKIDRSAKGAKAANGLKIGPFEVWDRCAIQSTVFYFIMWDLTISCDKAFTIFILTHLPPCYWHFLSNYSINLYCNIGVSGDKNVHYQYFYMYTHSWEFWVGSIINSKHHPWIFIYISEKNLKL